MSSVNKKEYKPTLRGTFHKWSFFVYLVLGPYLVFKSGSLISRIAVSLYLITLLNMYGLSSVLHITDWKRDWLETKIQKIDHASIFLLICGTYTPVCMCCLPPNPWVFNMLLAAWAVAAAGILKCILWPKAPKVFNVAFYFVCGLVIIPFLPRIFPLVSAFELMCYILGGFFYLSGGLVYGMEYPDPKPLVFGYHEIFHIFTIIANACFLIPVVNACVLS